MRNSLFRFLTAALVLYSVTIGATAQTKAFDVSRMDRTANACDDFFQFANGTWMKNTEIPPSQAGWGSFNILQEDNREILHDILEKARTANAPKGSNLRMLGDYYDSCMDEAAIEKAGTK